MWRNFVKIMFSFFPKIWLDFETKKKNLSKDKIQEFQSLLYKAENDWYKQMMDAFSQNEVLLKESEKIIQKEKQIFYGYLEKKTEEKESPDDLLVDL